MSNFSVWFLVVCGFQASLASAAQLTLAWEWDVSQGQPPWVFTLIPATGQVGKAITVTPVVPMATAACQQVAQATYVPGRTLCATLPCPAPGAFGITLQANESSRPSNMVMVGIADAACRVMPYADALTRPSTPPPEPPRSPPPSPQLQSVDAVPSPTMPATTTSSEPASPLPRPEDVVTLLRGPKVSDETLEQLRRLQDRLHTLLRDYHTQLKALQEAYAARLATYSPQMSPEAYRRLWGEYAAATEHQRALFVTMQAQRKELLDAYTTLLQP